MSLKRYNSFMFLGLFFVLSIYKAKAQHCTGSSSNNSRCSRSTNNSNFQVATWNIQKANNSNWRTYILNSLNVDHWAIQEAVSSPDVLSVFQNHYHTDYNPAWSSSSQSTGTLSASKRRPNLVYRVITEVSEPILLTPKSFIVQDINFGCSNTVRIINVHMINFLLGSGYRRNLNQISRYINNYNGPLIILGDFNNWNLFRTQTLLNWTEQYGLNLAYKENYNIQGLDHIFYRGLGLVDFYKPVVGLSDHEPVHGIFRCLRNSSR